MFNEQCKISRIDSGRIRRKLLVIIVVAAVIILVGVVPNWSTFKPLEDGVVADKILVEKSSRTLTLLKNGQPLKAYRVALGRQPVGHKQFKNDNKTPEGKYIIDYRNSESRYHLSLHISYPNKADLDYARSKDTVAGGDIFVHGKNPDGFWYMLAFYKPPDWTRGCIGLTNTEIEELWRAVPDGTPIEIRP